jgi:uncharacterized protein YqeY
MSLKNDLNDALKAAMKAKNELEKMTLRGALAAIKQIEVDEQTELEDPDILGVLQKEVKSRKESIADAEKAGRDDLIATANDEIAILERFLPQALTPEELEAIVKETIAEVGAASMADMGKVMGAIMPKVKGRADGGQVNQLVRQLLQAGE